VLILAITAPLGFLRSRPVRWGAPFSAAGQDGMFVGRRHVGPRVWGGGGGGAVVAYGLRVSLHLIGILRLRLRDGVVVVIGAMGQAIFGGNVDLGADADDECIPIPDHPASCCDRWCDLHSVALTIIP